MEINNFPGYFIYKDGRVFSERRNIFLKPGKCRGYQLVALTETKKKKTMKVHRIVAEHYIPNPENKPCVDHINRIRTDNRVENLRWVTNLENCQNRGTNKNNTSGHRNISFIKQMNNWKFEKIINKVCTQKYFKTKTEALVYKFCFILKQSLRERDHAIV